MRSARLHEARQRTSTRKKRTIGELQAKQLLELTQGWRLLRHQPGWGHLKEHSGI